MKISQMLVFNLAVLVAGIAGFPAIAGNTPPAVTATNAPSLSAEIPMSIFDVTSSPVKDPFFPHTTRLPMTVAANTNVVAVVDASIFTLKGLSGSVGSRLAIINNRTVADGETAEVTVSDGRKIKIHCLEIKENSVIIRADNQSSPIELRYEEHYLKHPQSH
ncbi:MAG TPA: hypothetical protein VN281_15780 [Verrucomicrobiae bacterium]|jgi:hypothetical protein|nr:hypothetical protein [Verrucomicrobiae bacterium]